MWLWDLVKIRTGNKSRQVALLYVTHCSETWLQRQPALAAKRVHQIYVHRIRTFVIKQNAIQGEALYHSTAVQLIISTSIIIVVVASMKLPRERRAGDRDKREREETRQRGRERKRK